MFHILFGRSQSGTLHHALKKMGVHKKETIISLWEILSIGPIQEFQEKQGIENRFAWLAQHMNDEFNELPEYRRSLEKALEQLQSIPDAQPITIWIADNANEQTGLRFVLHLLKGRTNAITTINTTTYYSELFNTKDLSYIISHTGEISSDRLQVIYEQSKHDQPLSDTERAVLEREWMALTSRRELLRIYKDEKIESVSIGHYDSYIVNLARQLQRESGPEDFMKATRLVGAVLGHFDQYVSDSFLEFRVRTLVEKGLFEMKGKFRGIRFYSIRLTSKGELNIWKNTIRSVSTQVYFKDPATEEEVAHIKAALNVDLPLDLLELLKESNGVLDEFGCPYVWSTTQIIRDNQFFRNFEDYKDIYMPFDHLLFFSDSGCGDLFGYAILNGVVQRNDIFVWDHESDSRKWVASSLEDFLAGWIGGEISV